MSKYLRPSSSSSTPPSPTKPAGLSKPPTGLSALERAQAFLRGERPRSASPSVTSTSSNLPQPKTTGSTRLTPTRNRLGDLDLSSDDEEEDEEVSDFESNDEESGDSSDSSDTSLKRFLSNLAKKKLETTTSATTTQRPATAINAPSSPTKTSYLKQRPQTSPPKTSSIAPTSRASNAGTQPNVTSILSESVNKPTPAPTQLYRPTSSIASRLSQLTQPSSLKQKTADEDSDSSIGSDFDAFLRSGRNERSGSASSGGDSNGNSSTSRRAPATVTIPSSSAITNFNTVKLEPSTRPEQPTQIGDLESDDSASEKVDSAAPLERSGSEEGDAEAQPGSIISEVQSNVSEVSEVEEEGLDNGDVESVVETDEDVRISPPPERYQSAVAPDTTASSTLVMTDKPSQPNESSGGSVEYRNSNVVSKAAEQSVQDVQRTNEAETHAKIAKPAAQNPQAARAEESMKAARKPSSSHSAHRPAAPQQVAPTQSRQHPPTHEIPPTAHTTIPGQSVPSQSAPPPPVQFPQHYPPYSYYPYPPYPYPIPAWPMPPPPPVLPQHQEPSICRGHHACGCEPSYPIHYSPHRHKHRHHHRPRRHKSKRANEEKQKEKRKHKHRTPQPERSSSAETDSDIQSELLDSPSSSHRSTSSITPPPVLIPDPVATDNLHLSHLQSLISTHLSYIQSYVAANFALTEAERATYRRYRYTTLEDTKKYLDRNRERIFGVSSVS